MAKYPFALTHAAVSVLNTTTVALAASSARRYALFVNDSDTVIYLKVGVSAVANQGIRLNANGGSYEMSQEFGNVDNRAVNAIASVTGKNLLVTSG